MPQPTDLPHSIISTAERAQSVSDDESDSDIYRGERPPTSPVSEDRYPDSISTTSSSSSWSFFAGRLGVLRVVHEVEQAIMRWRGNASTSSLTSSSSSSSSSRSSILTLTRSQLSKRRARRSSLANIRSLQSERDFTARISIIKAREESRLIPRQFSLYLPPSLRTTSHSETSSPAGPSLQGSIWTSSLSVVLTQLDGALKKTVKSRRNQEKEKAGPSVPPMAHHHFMLPEFPKAPRRAASFTDLKTLNKAKKGKGKESLVKDGPDIHSHSAWYLDVASPTPEDMRAIGKLLHLHPLTLEDILTQDPREKLELFPKLGYYLISFRAVESRKFHEKFTSQLYQADPASEAFFENSSLGEANVYIVVLNEGVCTFHFTDISEHTDRVRNRLTQIEKTRRVSSAWIAHGLLDSIVDSFLPFSDEIENELMAIEQIIHSGTNPSTMLTSRTENTPKQEKKQATTSLSTEIGTEIEKEIFSTAITEKSMSHVVQDNPIQTRFALPRPPLPLLYRRILRFLRSKRRSSRAKTTLLSGATVTLRRMAKTRRLVTTLTRLLATKSDVVSQVQKRLLSGGEDADVTIYLGDVHDHILTLQHSLAHYERMLSQSHPTYLSHLRAEASYARSGTDKNLIYLTLISMAVLCCQTLTGLFSMNVRIPTNAHDPSGSYQWFGTIIGLACLALTTFLNVVRWWWRRAKRRREWTLRG
ncbi:hypothetical protein K435DRAFT_267667 [Dendrothele bispora CBS 962.96]|uniref:Cora-domain-containing protein n=1 Tax=Dendrothele bispora (strain CBS 962.96) TaxID=1314807 RepID=A0A4S8MXA2_DENBC|nr:hypothetical protein K435DRAFT_267667 [Dendrothele bispora CBS 962.96]